MAVRLNFVGRQGNKTNLKRNKIEVCRKLTKDILVCAEGMYCLLYKKQFDGGRDSGVALLGDSGAKKYILCCNVINLL